MSSNGIEKTVPVARPSLGHRLREGATLILQSKTAMVGLAMVVFWIFVAISAPILTPYSPLEQDRTAANKGPIASHPLGTDDIGRDLWARLAYGARLILVLAPISVLCTMIVGTSLGLVAGYRRGAIDEVVMRVLDAMIAFPAVLLYLIIIAAVGPSTINVVVAIVITGSPGVARMVRSLTLDICTREYIAAARLRGESAVHIMFIEILPNASGPIIIDAMLRLGYSIFAIGTLGFLGLGLPPPAPDWGSMVARGRRYIWTNPWPVLWPSLAISSLVVGLNLLADSLSEATTRYQ
jgi:peptide/nickel transport system permease protein